MSSVPHAIVTHLGLGDCIVQAGLAITLLEQYDTLAFPCYPRYANSLRSIFVNEPRISIYTVPKLPNEPHGGPADATYEAAIRTAGLDLNRQIRLGLYAGRGLPVDFSKAFYEHAGVDYCQRWEACPIRDAWQKVPQLQINTGVAKRIFLHDDGRRGFLIHRARVGAGYIYAPPPNIDESILKYASYIMAADEIHVIDSCFLWLADSLPVKGRLYLHKYARWPRPHSFRYELYHDWIYID
jgi:hypothetical protein